MAYDLQVHKGRPSRNFVVDFRSQDRLEIPGPAMLWLEFFQTPQQLSGAFFGREKFGPDLCGLSVQSVINNRRCRPFTPGSIEMSTYSSVGLRGSAPYLIWYSGSPSCCLWTIARWRSPLVAASWSG